MPERERGAIHKRARALALGISAELDDVGRGRDSLRSSQAGKNSLNKPSLPCQKPAAYAPRADIEPHRKAEFVCRPGTFS